ncbi:DNA-binding protein RFX5 isoform X2 [Latimeria chalumnae]|uniref:DNA-binding protein RFX5 isoform X2 n=1 Tax=Latimeria chalumnae TaxID=7897 RepID=UPI0003C120EE|nr:PREDICTED: DNA-binding protein RFX5 isoform X2 [Latimeria chalumnae]|eukprot:XP_006003363.1 PREDICTED: DNA-binding protein RFX5 isoform X2 [Latimeria chalumnae]
MADNALRSKMSHRGGLTSGSSGGHSMESNTLVQKLRNSISKQVQSRVTNILQEVQKFSDTDKLFLYLQLPSGPSAGERRRYCDNLAYRPMSAANFGKIIRDVFPNIKARRLGGRGQSKYCYSGIRRKSVVSMAPLPSLDLKRADNLELTELVQSHNNEVMDAACTLICDWAGKILWRTFDSVVEVAQFLLQQHIISPRSASAELIKSVSVSEPTAKPYKVVKRPEPPLKDTGADSDEKDGAEMESPSEKENSCKPSSPKPAEKMKITETQKQKQASSPEVDALVARLPPLLPRMMPVKPLDGVRTSPAVLAPKIATTQLGGAVKVTPLQLSVGGTSSPMPITLPAGMNSAGLLSQQAAVPMINMILPSMPPSAIGVPLSEAQATPKSTGNEGVVAASAGKLREESHRATMIPGKGQKRQSELPTATGEMPPKRKRGRPRKIPPESQSPTKSSIVPKSSLDFGYISGLTSSAESGLLVEVIQVTIGDDTVGTTVPNEAHLKDFPKAAEDMDNAALKPTSDQDANVEASSAVPCQGAIMPGMPGTPEKVDQSLRMCKDTLSTSGVQGIGVITAHPSQANSSSVVTYAEDAALESSDAGASRRVSKTVIEHTAGSKDVSASKQMGGEAQAAGSQGCISVIQSRVEKTQLDVRGSKLEKAIEASSQMGGDGPELISEVLAKPSQSQPLEPDTASPQCPLETAGTKSSSTKPGASTGSGTSLLAALGSAAEMEAFNKSSPPSGVTTLERGFEERRDACKSNPVSEQENTVPGPSSTS